MEFGCDDDYKCINGDTHYDHGNGDDGGGNGDDGGGNGDDGNGDDGGGDGVQYGHEYNDDGDASFSMKRTKGRGNEQEVG